MRGGRNRYQIPEEKASWEEASSGLGEAEVGGDDGEEECEVFETDGEGSEDDDVANILALGGESRKCKPKAVSEDGSGDGSGSGDRETSGADALAEALRPTTCEKEGMDSKIFECLYGDDGTLEDKITLVLVEKGVISSEDNNQCDDNKQCLKQEDGMSRCQNPCERLEIIL